MTRNAFIGLLLLTIAAVAIGAQLAERYASPGIGRTLVVALFTALVVFPAGMYAERRGWIRGELDFSKPGSAKAAPAPDSDPPASGSDSAASSSDSPESGKPGDLN